MTGLLCGRLCSYRAVTVASLNPLPYVGTKRNGTRFIRGRLFHSRAKYGHWVHAESWASPAKPIRTVTLCTCYTQSQQVGSHLVPTSTYRAWRPSAPSETDLRPFGRAVRSGRSVLLSNKKGVRPSSSLLKKAFIHTGLVHGIDPLYSTFLEPHSRFGDILTLIPRNLQVDPHRRMPPNSLKPFRTALPFGGQINPRTPQNPSEPHSFSGTYEL